MRELFLATRKITDCEGRERRYDYYIMYGCTEVDGLSCESYGLRVTEQGSGATCSVADVTSSISRMDELCALVVAGGVGPLTLREVVEDWL